jgi:hypothetical protein
MSRISAKFIKDKSVASDPLKLIQWDASGDLAYVPNDIADWDISPTGALEGVDELAQRTRDLEAYVPTAVGQIPNTFISTAIPSFTSSTTFVQMDTMTENITIDVASRIHAIVTFSLTKSGGGAEDAEVRLVLDTPSELGDPIYIRVVSITDNQAGACQFKSSLLPAGTYTVRAEYRSIGGGQIDFLSGSLFMQSQQGAIGPQGPVGPAGLSLNISPEIGNFNAVDKTAHLVSGAFTGTLPVPSVAAHIIFKKLGTNDLTIARNGAELIDAVAADFVMDSLNQSATFISNGTDWFII